MNKADNPARQHWTYETLSSYIRSQLYSNGIKQSNLDDTSQGVLMRLWKATRAEDDLLTMPKSYILRSIQSELIDSHRKRRTRINEIPFSSYNLTTHDEEQFDPSQVAALPPQLDAWPSPIKRGRPKLNKKPK